MMPASVSMEAFSGWIRGSSQLCFPLKGSKCANKYTGVVCPTERALQHSGRKEVGKW